MSAPEAFRRHGVGLTALRARATREGWRRADQPWTPPNRLDPDDEGVAFETEVGGDLDRIGLNDLSWIAFRRMMRAALRGDAVEALRWRRVREAMDAEAVELDRLGEQQDAAPAWRPWPDPNRVVDATDPTDATAVTASDGVFRPDG